MKKSIAMIFGILTLAAACGHSGDLRVGDTAPDFTAVDDQGASISLKDFRGKSVVLYFYPKDDTPGCTAEAEGFRDNFKGFEGKNAVILGVSYDSAGSHQSFKEKHQLPFYLLVDSDKKISGLYGAKGVLFASRDTIVIDPQGKIQQIYRSVDPGTHIQEVLSNLK